MTDRTLGFLIVEDEALLAMDLAMLIEEAGHRVVGEAASLAEVAMLSEGLRLDCAFVDVQLLHGSSGIDAACVLRELRPDIRIVFVTANPGQVPAGFEGALGIVQKPFTRHGFTAAIRYVAASIGRDAAAERPPSILPIPERVATD